MESYILNNFRVKPKHSSEAALQRWRKLSWLVRNPKRRFRFTANLSKRLEAEAIRRSNQEKFRVAVLVSQTALQFIHDVLPSDYAGPEEEVAGLGTFDEESGSIVENPSNSTINGRTTDSDSLNRRQEIFGINLESVRKYFRGAATSVLVLCALIGSFTRVNNLLSFFRGLSSESACIPPLRWGGNQSPSLCESDETYTGYVRYLV